MRTSVLRRWWLGLGGALAVQAGAETVPVFNSSFESPLIDPTATPALPWIDGWQKTAKPANYNEAVLGPWDLLSGVYFVPPAGVQGHKENADGTQAAYLQAVPGVGVLRDPSLAPTNTVPTFEPGYAYRLTVGVIGQGGLMKEGVPLELGLYYRNDAGDLVPVAQTTVTNSPALFPNRDRFVEFSVNLPVVAPADAWAGRGVGVRLLSTVTEEMQGGYWDVENVRVERLRPPTLSAPAWTVDGFAFDVLSSTGAVLRVEASARPGGEWLEVGTVTNTTGQTRFVEPRTEATERFYRLRGTP